MLGDSSTGCFCTRIGIVRPFTLHDQGPAVAAGLATVDLTYVAPHQLVDIPATADRTAQHIFNTYMWSMEK